MFAGAGGGKFFCINGLGFASGGGVLFGMLPLVVLDLTVKELSGDGSLEELLSEDVAGGVEFWGVRGA